MYVFLMMEDLILFAMLQNVMKHIFILLYFVLVDNHTEFS